MRCHKTAVTLALLAAPLVSQAQVQPITAHIENIGVINVNTERAEMELTLRLSTTVHVKLLHVTFESMRLNGIPVYIAPLRDPLDLDPGGGSRLVQFSPIRIYYRDLESLAPLHRLIEDSATEIEGAARIEFSLPALQGISGPVHVVNPIHERVPVSALPGGPTARDAALAVIAAADTALHAAGTAVDRLRNYFGWTDEIAKQYAGALLLIETRYRYRQNGHTVTRTVQGMGFRTEANRFLTTAEIVQPWLFDPESAQSIQSGATLDDSFYDIRVWPSAASLRDDTCFSMRKQQLRVVDSTPRKESVLVAAGGKYRPVDLAVRNSPDNTAVLEFTGHAPSGSSIHPAASRDQQYDSVAIFRMPAGRDSARFEVVYVKARRDGNRIVLLDPVDSTAFGSPLIVAGGFIGMLQEETTAAALPNRERI